IKECEIGGRVRLESIRREVVVIERRDERSLVRERVGRAEDDIAHSLQGCVCCSLGLLKEPGMDRCEFCNVGHDLEPTFTLILGLDAELPKCRRLDCKGGVC